MLVILGNFVYVNDSLATFLINYHFSLSVSYTDLHQQQDL